ECEPCCVEERAAQRELVARTAVRRVTDNRVSDRREVHAYLVRAPCFEPAFEQRADRVVVYGTHLVFGARGLAGLPDRHARPPRTRPAYRRVDEPSRRRETAPYEREIPALDLVCGQRGDQRVVPTCGAGCEEQPAGIAIEAVHDAGPHRIPHRGDVGKAGEEAVDERAPRVAGTRMHDEICRLVDDDQVVVDVPHVELHVVVGFGRRIGLRLAEQLDDRALPEPVALGHRAPVHEHISVVQECLYRRSRPACEQRHRPVEALAVERGRHNEGLRHESLASIVRTTSTMAPTVTHESARLNSGHHPTPMKSTTYPCKNPGARANRSARLPSAPPSTSTSPMIT